MNINLSRIKRFLVSPSSNVVRIFFHSFYTIIGLINLLKKKENKAILVWDIRSNSVTFDFLFVIFYVLNSIKSREINSFELIIFNPSISSINSFLWSEYSKYVSALDVKNRIDDMIVPIAESFICIDKISYFSCNQDLLSYIKSFNIIFPRNYNPKYFYVEPLNYIKCVNYLKYKQNIKLPFLLPPIHTSEGLNGIYRQLNDKPYITYTLRDYGFMAFRNSKQKDIDHSLAMARKLNCELVIVPDEIQKINDYEIDPSILISFSGRKNMKDRISLYSKSIVNIFRPAGPAFISTFIENSKSLIIDFSEGGPDCNDDYYKKEYDIEVGEQPYLRLGSYLFWKREYPDWNYLDLIDRYNYLIKHSSI